MCIIFVNYSKRPDDETLIRAERRNSEGIGLAWRENGLVHWDKGIKFKDLMTRLHDDEPKYPYVIHFRIATSGGTKPELCHPFAVTEKASVATEGAAKAVLFHNGSWQGWEKEIKQALLAKKMPLPGGPWSDSRAMAFLAHVYGPNAFQLLDVDHQRICYFSNTKLTTWGGWEKRDGWWASNPSFQSYGAQGKLNIESDEEWMRNGATWDNQKKDLVPIARRPVDPPKGKGSVTVIKDGQIVSQSLVKVITSASTARVTDSILTKQKISERIFTLRVFAKRMGYSVERISA